MKTRWKEMNYNEELDCWVVFWGDKSGYKSDVENGLIYI
jgi:hypothetical protein